MLNLQNTFKKLESEGTREKMVMVKLVFVACNLMALGLGVWKVDKMGLLPYVDVLRFDECEGFANVVDRTTRSDWLAWETAREPLERSYPMWAI